MEMKISEDERYALAHADWAVSHATPDKSEVCFDYTLVRTLCGLAKRMRQEAEDFAADAHRMHQEKMDYFEANLLLRVTMQEACDLLAERTQGSPARSAGHNARVRLESGLTSHAGQSPRTED